MTEDFQVTDRKTTVHGQNEFDHSISDEVLSQMIDERIVANHENARRAAAMLASIQ